MMRRLWDVVSILAMANVLAAMILVLVLAASGGLTVQKFRLIRDILAGRPLPAVKVEVPGAGSDTSRLSTSDQMIASERTRAQVQHLQVEQQLRELRDFRVQLDLARATLDARIAQFEKDKASWEGQRKAERDLLAGEGFKKALVLYESMDPDQAKDVFMTLTDDEVVRLLMAMEERKASRIAKAFQSEPEKGRLKKILERMEKGLP